MTVAGKYLPRRIAIVDDEEDVVTGLERRLVRVGYEVQRVIPQTPDLSAVLAEIMSGSDACLCDHDLRGGHQVDFSGAEVVAALTENCFPSVLFTGVLPAERYVIRRNMARIPAFLPRDELDPTHIARALAESVAEVREGRRAPRRRGRRTPVTIINARVTGAVSLVEGLVAGWPGSEPVGIPADLLADPWRSEPGNAVGRTFFATINLGESDPDHLYFEDFESEPAKTDELLTPE
jgi:CheY-like chemotaxis protein